MGCPAGQPIFFYLERVGGASCVVRNSPTQRRERLAFCFVAGGQLVAFASPLNGGCTFLGGHSQTFLGLNLNPKQIDRLPLIAHLSCAMTNSFLRYSELVPMLQAAVGP